MEALRPDDPPRIGPFTPLARIGSGGMGRVYLARSRGGRPVAVKVIRSEYAEDPRFRTRFRREVEAARTVDGLYTASVLDAGPDDENPWLATAYIPGPPLQQLIADHGPLPERSARILAAGIAEALGAIHAAGLIHRDLKPSNVICGPDGPRVIDFGISHAIDAAGTALTATGLVVGSPRYASPEQCRADAEVVPASDVFALGGVLVYATTGLPPFGDGPDHVQLYLVVHEQPDLAGVPAALRPIVAACLDKDPANRPTIDRLLDELLPPDVADHGQDWLPAAAGGLLSSYAVAGVNTPSLPGAGPTDQLTHQRPDSDPVPAGAAATPMPSAAPAATPAPGAGSTSGPAPAPQPSRRLLLTGVLGGAMAASGGAAWWAATSKNSKAGASAGAAGSPTTPPATPSQPSATTGATTPASPTTPATSTAPNADGATWSAGVDLTWGLGAVVRGGRLLGIHQNTVAAANILTLVALHTDTGQSAWEKQLPPTERASTLPLAADDTAVYSYAGGTVTARRLTDGETLWNLPAGLPAPPITGGTSQPSEILGLLGGVLVVGVDRPEAGSQNCLAGIDVAAKKVLWRLKGDDLRLKLPAGLVAADATVVVTVPDDGSFVYAAISDGTSARQIKALSAATGKEAWSAPFTKRTQNASPQNVPTVSAADGAVYLTDMHSGYLHAYAAASGTWKWTYPQSTAPDATDIPASARFTGRVTAADGVVYASDATSVHAFDARTGRPLPGWAKPAAFPSGLRTAPTLAGGRIWAEADTPTAASGQLTLVALDPATGQPARQVGVPLNPAFADADTLVSDGDTLYVVSVNGGVQAFGRSH